MLLPDFPYALLLKTILDYADLSISSCGFISNYHCAITRAYFFKHEKQARGTCAHFALHQFQWENTNVSAKFNI